MRRNPATVVALAGHASEPLLGAVSGSMNVALIRPADPGGGLESAAAALRRAAGISSPYVLVAADPLAAVAAEWRAMWEVAAEPRGGDRFEARAAEALAAWRAGQFELPDYYLALAEETAPGTPGEQRQDFYLGPLRSVRPHRVAVVAAAEPAEQAAGVLSALGSLRHGRWWPSLEEIITAARGFYPGALAESPDAGQSRLLAHGGSLSAVPGAAMKCADACQVLGAAPAAPPRERSGSAAWRPPVPPVPGAPPGPAGWEMTCRDRPGAAPRSCHPPSCDATR
jgi:hypothetical protein